MRKCKKWQWHQSQVVITIYGFGLPDLTSTLLALPPGVVAAGEASVPDAEWSLGPVGTLYIALSAVPGKGV